MIKRVLILEDDQLVLDLFCLVLSSKGYVVLPARTAQEALRQAAECESNIDLLIADVVLTASTGIQVAVQLKQRLPHLKVLLVSGYPLEAWREQDCARLEAFQSQAVVVLQKPFLPEILLERVGRLIGRLPQQDI